MLRETLLSCITKIKLFIQLYFLLFYVELFGIDNVESFILLCLCFWFQG